VKLSGVGASGGAVVAPVVLLRKQHSDGVDDPVAALELTAAELQELARRNDGPLAEILEAQAMLAADVELTDRLRELAGELPGVEAIRTALAPFKAALSQSRSEYQRARVSDVDEIERRAVAVLTGRGRVVRDPPAPGILCAASLSPADTGQVPREALLGVVSGDGGTLSHAAIVSRALGIPAVVAVGEQIDLLGPGQWVALDGSSGTVELLDGPPAGARIDRRVANGSSDRRRGQSADGTGIQLLANVGSVQDARDAGRLGAEGCGLLRTEFVVSDRQSPPGVDEHIALYDELLAHFDGPVSVRAIDAGADKPLPFVHTDPEPNPALGRRGLRLLLDHPDLLTDQVRALCRCQHADRIALMLPLVTRAGEIEEARALLDPVFAEEKRRLPLGAMIEVPSAALAIDEIAAACDFVSVGTNDLFQYLFAADRSQGFAGALIDPVPPGVWRLIERVFHEAAHAGVPAGVCGELAADDHGGGTLWALGAHSLSISPLRLPALKDALAERTAAEWRALAAAALTQPDSGGSA
jgi:phosphoenolpyruvate-protein phosphotransferase (PTS system enzyme I)